MVDLLLRSELLKIALAFAQACKRPSCDDYGFPLLRDGYNTDLIGLFIPVSSYYATKDIERMTIYDMRDAGILNSKEVDFIAMIDEVALLTPEEWTDALEYLILEEKKNGQ